MCDFLYTSAEVPFLAVLVGPMRSVSSPWVPPNLEASRPT